jgi:gluconate 2-dehydrogenase
MTTRIAVLRPLPPDLIAMLREQGEVIDNPAVTVFDAEALAGRLADADAALVTALDRIDADIVSHCPKLRVIANIGVGYNNIDVDACTARGILVTNTPGSVDDATADLAFGLMLAASRRLVAADRFVRSGNWRADTPPLMGLDVHHRVLGIIGLGRIGKVIARRARGFDMEVRYFNRTPLAAGEEAALQVRYQDMHALLRESDFVVLQTPYSAETHHLIGAHELATKKKTAVLVNTARGGVVDDAALVEALHNRVIAAAGLDVFKNEPRLNPAFLELDNMVLAPLIGSATGATRHAMAQQAVCNLVAALNGMPPDAVNPQARR